MGSERHQRRAPVLVIKWGSIKQLLGPADDWRFIGQYRINALTYFFITPVYGPCARHVDLKAGFVARFPQSAALSAACWAASLPTAGVVLRP